VSQASRIARYLPVASERRSGATIAIFATVLLLAIAAFMAGGGGAPDESRAVLATDVNDDPADDLDDEPEASNGEVVAEIPVVTYEIYLARDPFDPVVPEDRPDFVDPNAAADADDPDAPDPDDPDAPAPGPDSPAPDPADPDSPAPDPADPDAPAPDECVGDEEVVCDGQVITLTDIATTDGAPVGIFQVDTTIYEVLEGQVFADRFRLLRLLDRSARVQFGDEVFDLPLGDRVMK
jgi:hypothetical protein